MKHNLSYLFLLMILQSCITINLYQTKPKKKEETYPKATLKTMLPMEKTIELDGTKHELLFFGEDGNQTFDVFSDTENDSLGTPTILIKTATVSDVSMSRWMAKDDDATIMLMTTELSAAGPLIIIDGQKALKGFSVSEIPSDKIQTIQVLKGSAAIEKYGEEAVNGVLEITTKQ
jgi:hypothetical protein